MPGCGALGTAFAPSPAAPLPALLLCSTSTPPTSLNEATAGYTKSRGDSPPHTEEMSQTMADNFTTNDAGNPVPSDEHSLTVGPDGPILLQDHYLIEQMANFNRERIPERQPHAKGGGAFGHFEVTNDVSQFTKAAVFQPGTKTDTADPVLDGRRRARQPRHLARPARIRAQALHVRGQPRHRREQRPDLLHPRSDEVPALHPFPETHGRQQPSRPQHAVGLLDAGRPSRRTCCPG